MRTERLFRTARARWHAGVFAASIMAWGGTGGMEARAQADAWISATAASNGNGNWTNLIGVPGTAALPIPGGANGYNGQVPRYSHHIRTNGSGNIIFFAVDGNLYDGDGYLIADARGTNCQECLAPGVLEFISLPMPGQCGVYYLFSSVPRSLTYDGSHVQVSILDMNEPNPRFQQADVCNSYRGRLIGLHDFEVQQRYPSLSAWELGVDYLLDPTAPLSLVVAQLPINPNGKSQSPMLRIVQGAGPNDPSFLFAIMTTKTFVYRLTNVGVDLISPVAGLDHFPTYSTNDPFTSKQFYRDADARRTANGEIRLVMTSGPGLQTYPFQLPIPPNHNMLAARFNGTTGTLVPGSVQGWLIDPLPNPCGGPGGNSAGGLAGCALDPSANGAWYLAENTSDCNSWQPKLAHIEFATGTITDASAQVPGLQAYVRSRMYRNSGPSNTEDIHIPHAGGVAAFQNTAVPGTVTVTPSAFSGAFPPLHADPPGEASNNYQPRFLNTAVQGDTHLSIDNIAQCCTYFQTVPGAVVGGHIQVPGMSPVSWDGASNPLQPGSSTLVFNCDLVVESGAQLILNNLTAKFTDGAKIIVKRGGTLRLNNSTATSLSCPNERWPGIQLEGQTHASNDPTNLQGNLRIYSSTIENAVVGVRTGRFGDPLNGAGDPAYYGGRVLAYNSTFRDCNIGALIERHHANTANGGTEQPNQSLFSNCEFVTTNAWPGGQPLYGLFLNDVRHIRVNNCRFENQAPGLFQPDYTGSGIFMGAATVRVLGNGDPTQSYMRNLRNGVVNSGAPFNPVQVDRMHFENNVFGILDFAGRGVNYSRNTFLVPDQGAAPSERRGMLLWQTRQMLVEQNSFTGEGQGNSVGIHFVSSVPSLNQNWGYTDERIYNNTFSNLAAGEMVKGVHRGNNSGDLEAGLQLLCGDHTNNTYDIALLDQSLLKPNQGGQTVGSGQLAQLQLSGNRFYDNEDCTTRFDWAVDANWNVIPGWFPGMQLNYKRHEFPEDLVGVTCDQHPQFFDLPVPFSGVFNKVEHCGNGEIPIDPGSGTVRAAAYAQAKSQLVSALDLYNGTVDLGDKLDLLEAITQNTPWLSSAQLRDLLLTKYPLSDDVLKAVMRREQPLDVWHLTQVLLQNSPLNRGLWNLAQDEALLPPFFLNMVAQAQEGQGPSAKQLLEQEIAQRRYEMSAHMTVLIQLYGHDTTSTGSLDSLKHLMLFDKDLQFSVELLESKMAKGDFSDAEGLLNEKWQQHNGKEVYADMLTMMQETQRQWEQLTMADKETLRAHAESQDQGAAMAAGILFTATGEAPVPAVAWPNFTKRGGAPSKPRREAQWSMGSELATYPNPASDQAFVLYPAVLDGALLNVHDAHGQLVWSTQVRGNGMLELQVANWAPGLYHVSLAGTALSTKLIVKP